MCSTHENNNLIKFISKLIGRGAFFAKEAVYRKVIFYRLVLSILRWFNPQIKYIGLRFGQTDLIYFADDKTITLHALAQGFYHQAEFNETITLLEENGFVFKNGLLEIGANIGTTTVAAAKSGKFGFIYCFEPVRENAALLRAQLALNPSQVPTHVVEKAISSAPGVSSISRSPINYGDNRVLINNLPEVSHNKNLETIECIDLDSFLKNTDVDETQIDLLWVDTQGLEALVLQGATHLLSLRRIPWLIEFWPEEMKRNQTYTVFYDIVPKYFTRFIDTLTKEKRPIEDLVSLEKSMGSFHEFKNIVLMP